MTYKEFEKAVKKLFLNIDFGIKYIEIAYLKDVVAVIDVSYERFNIHRTNWLKMDKSTQEQLMDLLQEFAETPPRKREMFRGKK